MAAFVPAARAVERVDDPVGRRVDIQLARRLSAIAPTIRPLPVLAGTPRSWTGRATRLPIVANAFGIRARSMTGP